MGASAARTADKSATAHADATAGNPPIPGEFDACAREPIHIPGSIQPHGYLFVLNTADFTVASVSQNAADAIGVRPEDLIGRPIDDYLIATAIGSLDDALKSTRGETPLHVRFRQSPRPVDWDCIIHPGDALVILELGRRIGSDRAEALLGGVRYAIERIRISDSPEIACEILAEEVRRLTEFDRVMVYRFDPDWNGRSHRRSQGGRRQALSGPCLPRRRYSGPGA